MEINECPKTKCGKKVRWSLNLMGNMKTCMVIVMRRVYRLSR